MKKKILFLFVALIMACSLLSQIAFAENEIDAQPISADCTKVVYGTITNSAKQLYFTFTPSVSDTYELVADGAGAVECKLYHSDIGMTESIESGVNSLTARLIKDQTYYFALSYENPDVIGQVAVNLHQYSGGSWDCSTCDRQNMAYIDYALGGEDLGSHFNHDTGHLIIYGSGILGEDEYPYWCATSDCEIQTVEILEGVTGISDSCFAWEENLSYITLPESMESIGEWAFEECTNLQEIHLPKKLTSIGYGAFSKCSSLKSFTVDAENEQFCADTKGVLYTKDMSELYVAPGALSGSYVVPQGVTGINHLAFSGCSQLSNLELPSTLEGTGAWVFQFSGIEEITIPATLKKILQGSFYQCENLEKIIFLGDAPAFEENSFENTIFAGVNAKAIYPAGNQTWTASNMKNYGGRITWFPSDNKTGFVDVASNAYYHDAVLWAVENNITSGTSDITFGPTNVCTRAQVVTFLWNAAGKPEPTQQTNPFTDVNRNAYYYKAVLWAVENGITSGTSATTFSPTNVCTRAQVVTFLWNAGDKPQAIQQSNPFSDISNNAYYYKAVLWAVENGITAGTAEGIFSPTNKCTRAQVVSFLYRNER